MIYLSHDGVHYSIESGEVNDFHNNLSEIKADIQTMRDTNDHPQKWGHNPGKWDIQQSHGITNVNIYGKQEELEEEVKDKEEEKFVSVKTYCLLVEMGNSSFGDYTPDAWAIFVPGDDGHKENILGAANLTLKGFTSASIENELGVHDPPGWVGQATKRLRWCKKGTNIPGVVPILPNTIEQVKRIDGGWLAYPGERYPRGSEVYEVSEIWEYSNLWSYEGIDYVNRWYSVTPGPPPEGVCGYTWAIHPNYSPDGWEADEWDRKHLFYGVNHASGKLLYVWPEELNQLIEKREKYRVNTCLYRSQDAYDDLWNIVGWKEVQGDRTMEEVVGTLCFPSSIGRLTVTNNNTERIWGLVWGDQYTPTLTQVKEIMDFPFTDYEQRTDSFLKDIDTDYFKDHYNGYGGIFVRDRWQDFFINSFRRWSNGNMLTQDYMTIQIRTEQVPADRFTGALLANLTDNQLEILKGNEDAVPEWFGSGDDRLYRIGTDTYAPHVHGVTAGGKDYLITNAKVVGQFTDGYNVQQSYWTYLVCTDYGIFAKVGTCTKGEGALTVVDPENIKKENVIYAYAGHVRGGVAGEDYSTAFYGMILDGLHYKTEEFVRLSSGKFLVPGTEDARDEDNQRIYCGIRVRIGVITSNFIEKSRRRDS